ncbi:MAG: GAF domain-containing protein [Elusimicrobia bacterium]|nr:GAF domain-containing protein [Elusimicrobiota bacterium]
MKKSGDSQRTQKLEAILEIAKAMAVERNLTRLLEEIVENARQVAGAERGSIFILDRERGELWSKIAQGSQEIRFPADRGIAGYVVKTRKPLNIADAYGDERFNPEVDKTTGYRTRNLLTVPMVSAKNEVIGVLQVLNKAAAGLAFDSEDEELLLAFSGQAAAAVENALLYEEISRLFEGFVSASVGAIEARDPTTSGHSERVAVLTCTLADAVNRIHSGPLAKVSFSLEQIKEIRYAAVLHDFGKVGVREHVLVKAEKLYPHELTLVLARFDFIRRTLEKEALERQLAIGRTSEPREAEGLLRQAGEDLKRRLEELEDARKFILASNVPTVLDRGGFERLQKIAIQTYSSFEGPLPYLSSGELLSLSIPRGSLTPQDRLEIESHVTHTYNFLSKIPWTRNLRRVPEIAYGHHEKLDGSGYPRATQNSEIPVQTRMMTICDIYDALTASDRPYKKAVPVPKALDILADEVKQKKVDAELFRVFAEARIFERMTFSRCGT